MTCCKKGKRNKERGSGREEDLTEIVQKTDELMAE